MSHRHPHHHFRPVVSPAIHFGRHHKHHGSLSGLVWMIGLPVLFMTGFWMPGIFILIGLSILVGAMETQQTPEPVSPPPAPEWFSTPPPPPAPAPVFRPYSSPEPVASKPLYRTDLLPATCSHCGGPVRSGEVKWVGPQSASCAYCGSVLSMKKS